MNLSGPVLIMAEGVPLRMKIPSGTAHVGFASEELGQLYLAAFRVDTPALSFSSINSAVASWSDEKKSWPLIFFRTREDLALFAKDKKTFPYADFLKPISEFEKTANQPSQPTPTSRRG